MICEKYNNLNPIEKIQFIGSLHHAAMSDDNLFEIAESIIEQASKKGLFKGVTIFPEQELIKEGFS